MRGWFCVLAVLALCVRGMAAGEQAEGGAGEARTLLTSGRELLTAGKSAEAIALLEKAAKLDPRSQEARFLLSAAYIEASRCEDARPILEGLLTDMPDNPMVKNNLAWVYVKSKDPSIKSAAKAVRLARAAVLDAPSDYMIWNTLSEAYYADGRYDRALQAAQSALRLSLMAGVTNTANYRELVSRCRSATGKAEGDDAGKDAE